MNPEEIKENFLLCGWYKRDGICNRGQDALNVIEHLQAELDKLHWIPVSATSEDLPKRPDFWGKLIFAIIDGVVLCTRYYGYRIGMTHWMPIIFPKEGE